MSNYIRQVLWAVVQAERHATQNRLYEAACALQDAVKLVNAAFRELDQLEAQADGPKA